MIYTSKKANVILKMNHKYISNIYESDNCLWLHDYIGFKVSENREDAVVFTTKRAKKIINAFPNFDLVMECVKIKEK